MAEAASKPHKKNQGNHDGCADCVRQKKENEAFIKIYERLQEVDKKTSRIRQAVNQHRNNSQTNRSFYRSYEERVVNLPKVKDRESPLMMENSGYELAASLVEKQVKSNVIAENKRLKDILFKMQRQQNSSFLDEPKRQYQNRGISNHNIFSQPHPSLAQSFASQINSTSLYSNKSQSQKMTNSQDTNDSCRDDTSTKSSSFNLTKARNSMDMSKYNDLNLWLYHNQKNAKLEEQLYIPKPINKSIHNNRSFISKRTNSMLPSLKK